MTSQIPEPSQLNTIPNVMDSILEACVGTLESYGISIPEKRYLTFGSTAHDSEQLTVTLIQTYIGPPGDQAQGPQPCDGPRSGVFTVELVRCIPVGNQRRNLAPDAEDYTEYAHSRGRDLWALLDAAGTLHPYNGVIADASVSEPQGAYQAVVLNLVVML